MHSTPLAISDILLLEPEIYYDDRGYFFENFNQRIFEEVIGRKINFVQDNQSMSKQHVLRGLHFQIQNAQGKLVHVIQGDIFDVAVDIRSESPTFGQWTGIYLSSKDNKHLWIPEGFAHGFLVLSFTATIAYKVTDYYHPEKERCIRWDDENIGIQWPLHGKRPILSPKDAAATPLCQLIT